MHCEKKGNVHRDSKPVNIPIPGRKVSQPMKAAGLHRICAQVIIDLEIKKMDSIIWLIIMIPVSLLFTGIGIYAWRREKPMWFWSGSTVKESEISDIAAYNRANGFMWISFSLVMWISTVLGAMNMKAGGIFLMAGCIIGVPVLPIVYGRIYRKYKK